VHTLRKRRKNLMKIMIRRVSIDQKQGREGGKRVICG